PKVDGLAAPAPDRGGLARGGPPGGGHKDAHVLADEILDPVAVQLGFGRVRVEDPARHVRDRDPHLDGLHRLLQTPQSHEGLPAPPRPGGGGPRAPPGGAPGSPPARHSSPTSHPRPPHTVSSRRGAASRRAVDSVRTRVTADWVARCASARLRCVMSRAIAEAPAIFPLASRMGETVREIVTLRPSCRTRTVSKCS